MIKNNNPDKTVKFKEKKRSSFKFKIFKLIGLLFIIALSLIFIYPLFWMLDSSFRPSIEIFQIPPVIFQKGIASLQSYSLNNYIKAFVDWKIGTAFLMSIIVTTSSIVLTVVTCSLAAYAFAFLKFPYKNIIFIFVLATMMLPTATMIPSNYKLLKTLHLTNNLLGLILPSAVSAFGIFMLRQFYIKIPYAFIESAMLEGAGHLTIWAKIILPLSKPAIAALSIFQFRQVWNDFLMPQIILRSDSLFTIPVKIKLIDGVNLNKPYDVIMATGFLFTLIPIIFFLIFQRQFIQGLTGGVKN